VWLTPHPRDLIQSEGERERECFAGIDVDRCRVEKECNHGDMCFVGPRSVSLSRDEYQVHEVATVLKRFLRTLDDPLLTTALYDQWIAASRNY